MGVKQLLISCS